MTAIPPPAHIEPYIEVLGQDLGIEFLLAFGGAPVYLTETPQSRSVVVARIGREKAVELARRLGSGSTRVPTAKPYIAAIWRAQGVSVHEIARRLHVTDVSVRAWFRPVDKRQGAFDFNI